MLVALAVTVSVAVFSHVQSNPFLQTPTQYGHLIMTDSLLCPWGKKALTFSLTSTHLIWTLSGVPSLQSLY